MLKSANASSGTFSYKNPFASYSGTRRMDFKKKAPATYLERLEKRLKDN